MKLVQAKSIFITGIVMSTCCMHSMIVPSEKQSYAPMMQEKSRQSDRQATAAEREVIRQQRAIEEQIHINLFTQALQKHTEEQKAFTVERQNTIEAARSRLAQVMQKPLLHVPATDINDLDQPVGPSQSHSPRAE